jgi:hypothetical protein
VWGAGHADELYNAASAVRRWTDARNVYLESIGVDRADFASVPRPLGGGAPWSFGYLARNDRRRLAERLAAAGLPADWQPELVDVR